eukprot:jgi/Hompol1/5811/HPOL_000728-RA
MASSAHLRKRPPIEMPFVVEQAHGDEPLGREMPFIVGKNTGKSFSVTANLQRVFSLLKAHNPGLCSVCDLQLDVNQDAEIAQGIGSSGTENLRHVLGVLEDEFRELKALYNELVSEYEKIVESTTSRPAPDVAGQKTLKAIGDELRLVIQNMETKGDQITILREILQTSIVHRLRGHSDSAADRRDGAIGGPGPRAHDKGYLKPTITSSLKVQDALAETVT